MLKRRIEFVEFRFKNEVRENWSDNNVKLGSQLINIINSFKYLVSV